MPAKSKQNIRGSRTKLNLSSRSISQSDKNLKNPSASKKTIDSQSSNKKKISSVLHRHACRAHIRDALNFRKMRSEEKFKKSTKNKRMELFRICEQYKRKMSEGFQVPEEQYVKHRKISWGEESEYVNFDRTQTCQSIKLAPRHKFSIDQRD